LKIPPKGLSHSFMDLTDPALDFVEMAHGMGMAGKLITRPEEIQPAMREALALGAPYVLEVRTEGRVPPQ
jgi:thiamine pyrophosphate-dependent acetolactate synthase large subunit-like protein